MVEWFQSGFVAVPRPLFDQLGGYDERFAGAGYEDQDIALRARAAGHRIVLDRTAGAIHDDYSLGNLRASCLRTRQAGAHRGSDGAPASGSPGCSDGGEEQASDIR